jgi:hypothetical protein
MVVGFHDAEFSGGTVAFLPAAEFSGGTVDFTAARFSGGTVDFRDPSNWSAPPAFSRETRLPQPLTLPKKEDQSQG